MTTYKEIHGTKIEVRDDDPANPVNGQMWYNSGTLKGFKLNPTGAWGSGGNINLARRFLAGSGTKTAGLIFGGSTTPPETYRAHTEAYDGTSWTEVNDLNTAKQYRAGNGTQTSSLCTGGNPGDVANNESWNGTSWTEVADLNTGRHNANNSGADNTSAVCMGGYDGTNSGAATETWNGSSWTETGVAMNTGRDFGAGAGMTYDAALYISGNGGGTNGRANVESWNGSSWTEIADLNDGRYGLGANGTSTSAIAFGGNNNPPTEAKTEQYNGTSWTEVNDLTTARDGGGSGMSPAAGGFFAGGRSTPSAGTITAATEEWSEPVETTVSFTVS